MGGYATNPDTNATSEITGSGTANYMAKFTAAQVIGNSTVQDDGTTVSTVSKMSVGNYATPTNLRQFTVGQDTAYMSFGSVVSATSYSAIYFSSATPSGTNYTLAGDGTSTFLNAATNLYLRIGASNRITLTDNAISFTPNIVGSSAITSFTFTGSANTGQTASTEINRLLLTTSSRQWATGAITTQREVYITSPTYSFVGASTITDAYTLYVAAPTASTNATITNSWAGGFQGNIQVGTSSVSAYTYAHITSAGSNDQAVIFQRSGSTGWAIGRKNANAVLSISYASSGIPTLGTGEYFTMQNYGAVKFTPIAATTNASIGLEWAGALNLNQTASTEINGWLITTNGRQWATGAITTQREVYITSPTYSFVGASTITDAFGLYVEAPTAGTNATITNNYAAGFNSTIRVPGIVGSNTLNYTLTYKNTTGTQTSTGTCHSFTAGDNTVLLSLAYKTITFSPSSGGSGASSSIVYSPGSNTGQTASTEINGFLYNSYTRTWAAGAITTQREQYIKTVTYAFASASTISEAYGMYIEPPTVGSNATITNNFGLGISNGSYSIKMGQLTGSSTVGAIYMLPLATTVDATNYTLKADGTDTFLNAQLDTSLYLRNGNNTVVRLGGTFQTFSPRVAATGALTNFTFIQSANTGQTASTEIPGFKFTGGSRQWSTGAITTQRETYFSTTTYTAVGASTITNAYGMYVEAPTASTNITITNNYALGLSGDLSLLGGNRLIRGSNAITLDCGSGSGINMFVNGSSYFAITANNLTVGDATNFVFNTTTGTKIGTATTQKIGFWNATPIVQPTTAVTAATFVANTSGIVNDTATFDGYTIGQVVKALRNEGLLA